MAVPDSGVLSLLAIYNELAENNYSSGTSRTNVSLNNLSTGGNPPNQAINTVNAEGDRPDGGSNNHAMSEFYSYDHDLAGISAPSSLTYSDTSTSRITFSFTEAANSTRVYVYIVSVNGTTTFAGQTINVNGSAYLTVNGSGVTSFLIGDGNDTYLGPGDNPDLNESIGTNDYLTIRYKSYDAGGNLSAFSSNITGWTTPTAPGAPSLTVNSTSQITATWSAPTGGASNYKVYVDAGTSSPTTLRTTQSGTSYAQTGLSRNTQYGFRIITVGGGGDLSAYSSNTSLYTLPDVPLNLAVDGTPTGDSIDLTWDAPPGGASNYKLEYRQYPFGSFSLFSTQSNTFDTVDFLSQGTQYAFRVAATNADGAVGATSAQVIGQTDVGKSDRRLKTNIERIGYSDMNIPIYLFNYKDDLNTTYQGVMAQDLLEMGLKDAVVMEDDGYYAVFYNKIDVNQIKKV